MTKSLATACITCGSTLIDGFCHNKPCPRHGRTNDYLANEKAPACVDGYASLAELGRGLELLGNGEHFDGCDRNTLGGDEGPCSCGVQNAFSRLVATAKAGLSYDHQDIREAAFRLWYTGGKHGFSLLPEGEAEARRFYRGVSETSPEFSQARMILAGFTTRHRWSER